MKKIRTRRFRIAMRAVSGFSVLFLTWFFVMGRKIAVNHFDGMLDCVFAVLGLAAASFLAVSFLPYFRTEKRWYAVPAMLTLVFFAGAMILWQVPVTEVIA